MSDPSPAPGVVIDQRYRLDARIARGSTSDVWQGRDLQLDLEVAIKVIDHPLARRPDVRDRLVAELRAATRVESPYVAKVHGAGVFGDAPYVATELLRGELLSGRIARLGRLSPADTATLLGQVAEGLGKAHAVGVLHRDLRPDGVVITQGASGEQVKVIDLGMAPLKEAGFYGQNPQTVDATFVGAPGFLSPEQVSGAAVDHRADLWSIALITFECITGQRAFAGPASQALPAIAQAACPVPSRVAQSVPPAFDAWFAQATSRDIAHRFADTTQLAASLRTALTATSRGLPAKTVVLASSVVQQAAQMSSAPPAGAVGAPSAPPPAPFPAPAAGGGDFPTPFAAPGDAPPPDAHMHTPLPTAPAVDPSLLGEQPPPAKKKPPVALVALGAVAAIAIVGGGIAMGIKTLASGSGDEPPATSASAAPEPAQSAPEPAASAEPPASASATPEPPPSASAARRLPIKPTNTKKPTVPPATTTKKKK